MKAIKLTLAICLMATVAFSNNPKVSGLLPKPDEAYVDDIPFNTEEIAKLYTENYDLILFEEDEYTDIPTATREEFKRAIRFPEFAKQTGIEEACVAVSFIYDEFGYMHVTRSNSSHPEFDAYVRKKLEDIRLKNGSVKMGKEYYAKFNFMFL